jgi:Excalibur calcium-binding domain
VTHPPLDEPSQQRRAAVYGRANQASAHYRPLRKGRPMPEAAPAAAPISRASKAASRRRLVLFVVVVLVAIAFGTAIFGVVLANPAPMTQAPNVPAPQASEPTIQPLPPTGQGAPVEHAPPPHSRSGPAADDSSTRKVTRTAPAPGAEGSSAAPATSSTVYYQNCNKARRAGAAPLRPGDPGYRAQLDKDGNGIACDEKDDQKEKDEG